MSGITGVFFLDGRPVERGNLEQMNTKLAHRGPDGSSIWMKGQVGLGHQILHTTPESLYEKFPLAAQGGNRVLTADARIDNREELIGLLKIRASAGRPVTDSELILAAYEKWGLACPQYLTGDFSFALWDDVEQHLFCARDHMGIKPFYYHHHAEKLFAFGSEIKAILSLDAISKEVDELRIAYFLAREADDPEITFYKHVRCLPAAHWLTVKRDGALRRHRYWRLDPERRLELKSDDDYAAGFAEVFKEAIGCRLRSNATPGVMLSGGLDSSSVACISRDMLREEGRNPLSTFSAVFTKLPEEDLHKSDERHFVDAIVAQGEIESHNIDLSDMSPMTNVDRMLRHLDAPNMVSNIYLVTSLYEAAQKSGINIMLDGAEGDIVVSHGTAYLAELSHNGQWNLFANEAISLMKQAGASPQKWFQRSGRHYLEDHAQHGRWRMFFQGVHVLSKRFSIPRRYLLWRYGFITRVPESVRSAIRRRPRNQQTNNIPSIIAPKLAHRTDFEARTQEIKNRYTPKRHTMREMHWLNLDAGAGSIAAILSENNQIAAAYGIEERHPFYDHRLVSYCLSLPPEQSLNHGWTRVVLRNAMKDVLPEKIRTRTDKADLSPNFYRNLLRLERNQLENVIKNDLDLLSTYVNVDALKTAYKKEEMDELWLTLILSKWLKQVASN